MPIIPRLSSYRDHAFTTMHDAITKTLAVTLRPTLVALTIRTNTDNDTVMEPTGLIREAPTD
jgi:hypothetical protein